MAEQRTSRPVLWVLLGLAMGLFIPLFLFGATMLIGVLTFTLAGPTLTRLAGPTTSPIVAEHRSGPTRGPAVAVITITGPIVTGRVPPSNADRIAATENVLELVRRASEDRDVRAIVLRVNSPGGSVVASDEIYYALKQVEKPLVVYMEEMAASGGFYISMAADYIVANPNTLTGSIGVISQFPKARELLDKLGIEFVIIKSGEFKDAGHFAEPMSEEEKAWWQRLVGEAHERFVQVVAEGRNLPAERVRELADGRVFTGRQALEVGLIDAVGYYDDAVDKAAQLGDIKREPRVVEYRYARPLSLFDLFSFRAADASTLLGFPVDLGRLLMPSLEYRWEP